MISDRAHHYDHTADDSRRPFKHYSSRYAAHSKRHCALANFPSEYPQIALLHGAWPRDAVYWDYLKDISADRVRSLGAAMNTTTNLYSNCHLLIFCRRDIHR